MPYPKDHKSKTKERILRSATELFCRYGFDRVSIGEIMRFARMTHGAFYAHFKSKEALFTESLREALRRTRVARLTKGPLALKQLTTLVTDYLNICDLTNTHRPGPESILVTEIGSDHVEVKRLYEEAYERMRKVLETRITALSRLKQLPFTPDRETIAEKSRAILASLVGAVAMARSISREDEQRKILLAAQRQILAMLGVKRFELELDAALGS